MLEWLSRRCVIKRETENTVTDTITVLKARVIRNRFEAIIAMQGMRKTAV